MQGSYLSRLAIFSSFVIFSSCAHRAYEGYSAKKSTPSGMINDFKAESQKRDLDTVVTHGVMAKPNFLKIRKTPRSECGLSTSLPEEKEALKDI